jgi:hypothetical protein
MDEEQTMTKQRKFGGLEQNRDRRHGLVIDISHDKTQSRCTRASATHPLHFIYMGETTVC